MTAPVVVNSINVLGMSPAGGVVRSLFKRMAVISERYDGPQIVTIANHVEDMARLREFFAHHYDFRADQRVHFLSPHEYFVNRSRPGWVPWEPIPQVPLRIEEEAVGDLRRRIHLDERGQPQLIDTFQSEELLKREFVDWEGRTVITRQRDALGHWWDILRLPGHIEVHANPVDLLVSMQRDMFRRHPHQRFVLWCEYHVVGGPTVKWDMPNLKKVYAIHGTVFRSSDRPVPERSLASAGFVTILRNPLDVDALVWLSQRQLEQAAELRGASASDVVIPHYVVPPRLPAQVERIPGKYVFVGRFDAVAKRQGDAVELIARLRDRGIRRDLYLVGDGPTRQEVEDLAVRLRVADRIHFTGFLAPSEVAVHVASAELGFLLSNTEGFPLTILEAMSLGTPVVSYDIEYGPAEIIVDGRNGILLERVGDIDSLVDRVAALTSDDLRRMSRGAARSTEHYSREIYATRVMGLLTSLIDLPPKRPKLGLVESWRVRRELAADSTEHRSIWHWRDPRLDPTGIRTRYVEVDVEDERNILRLSRQSWWLRDLTSRLLAQDYVLYHHRGTRSCFVQRRHVRRMWRGVKDGTVKQDHGVYWSETLVGEEQPRRMIVVFSSLPPGPKYYSHSMADRCFVKNNPRITEFTLRDMVVVRMADLNRMYGSYYMSTANFPDYEDRLARVLGRLMAQYGLHPRDVLMYGSSKGAVGALLNGLRLGTHILAMDPILSMRQYNDLNDLHFMEDVETVDRLAKVQGTLVSGPEPRRYLVSSNHADRQVRENFFVLNELLRPTVDLTLIDVGLPYVRDHPQVTTKTLNLQNMIMNTTLLGLDDPLEALRDPVAQDFPRPGEGRDG